MVAGSYSSDLWAFDMSRPSEGWRGADGVSGGPPPPRGWMQVSFTGNKLMFNWLAGSAGSAPLAEQMWTPNGCEAS